MKLFEIKFKTRSGEKIKYVIAKDETDAVLGLVINGKVKHSDITMLVKEVEMSEKSGRKVLKGEYQVKKKNGTLKDRLKDGPSWKGKKSK